MPTPINGGSFSGTLTPGDAITAIRGGGQKADYYRFYCFARRAIDLTQPVSGFPYHAYLRNALGELVASWSSVASSSQPYCVPESQEFTLEITSHDVSIENDTYQFDLHISDCLATISITVGGKVIPNDGTIEFGPDGEISAELTYHGVTASGFIGLGLLQGNAPFSVSPTFFPSLPPGATRTINITNLLPAEGLATGTLIIQGYNGNEAYTSHLRAFKRDPLVPDQENVFITAPASNSVFVSPASVPIQITAFSATGGGISEVQIFAIGPKGRFFLGNATGQNGFYSYIWSSPAPATYVLTATAVEAGAGYFAALNSAPVAVSVLPPQPNARPIAQPDVYTILPNASSTRLFVLNNDSDPDGDPLRIIEVSDSPNSSAVVSPDGQSILYTPDEGIFGTDTLYYRVLDGKNGVGIAQVTVKIVHMGVTMLTPQEEGTFPNMIVTLPVDAKVSSGNILRVEFIANGTKIGETNLAVAGEPDRYKLRWKPAARGFYRVKAVVWCDSGFSAASDSILVPVDITIDPQNPPHPPLASIDNLQENQLVRDGHLDLRGTADDEVAALLVRYKLELLKPKQDGLEFVQNVTPTNPPLDGEGYHAGRVAAGGSLGLLDFTGIRNGVYVLQLTVDNFMQPIPLSLQVRFILDSQAKIGQLTFSEQDLSIQGPGIPLTVVRTYDSFNTNAGDFGKAWTLTIHDLDIELDEERAPSSTPDAPMRVAGDRNVTLTLPDGRRTTFGFKLVPGKPEGEGDQRIPCFCYEARFESAPGVFARLGTLDNDRIKYFYGTFQFPAFWDDAGPGTPLDNYDFRGFVLTNDDGAEYTITRDYLTTEYLEADDSLLREVRILGEPHLSSIKTKSGEQMQIVHTASGIKVTHFGPPVNGEPLQTRGLYVQRNNSGRVEEIYAPDGLDENGLPSANADPAVKYIYDEQTGEKLTEVHRLVDKELNTWEKTRYVYADGDPSHYIAQIQSWQEDDWVTLVDNSFENGRFVGGRTPGQTEGTGLEHDLANRREIVRDALGRRSIIEYDPRGNVVRTVNPLGEATSRTYDTNNNVLSETDGLNRATTYKYDGFGNRTEVNDAAGNSSTFEYERTAQLSQLRRMRDANLTASGPGGYTTQNEYDASSRNLTKTIDALAQETLYAYVDGRLDTITDPLGNQTVHEYYGNGDPNGRPDDLKSVRVLDAASTLLSLTTYAYDSAGNRVSETVYRDLSNPANPAGGVTTSFFYDSQNRLLRTTNALNQESRTEYELGRVKRTTDFQGRVTEYFYDARGNLVQTLYPFDDEPPSLQYHLNQNPVVSRTVYDELNRPVFAQDRVELPEAAPWYVATVAAGTRTVYDPAGRVARTERLDKFMVTLEASGLKRAIAQPIINNPGSTTVPQYDVLSMTATEYDAAGQVSVSIDANGNRTRYEYDAAGRRSAVLNALSQRSEYSYDPNGNQTEFRDGRGVSTSYVYDSLNRRIEVVFPLLPGQMAPSKLVTGYDALGRRIQETDQESKITRFGYDGLGRLVSVTNAFGTSEQAITRYKYDGAGNLTEQTDAEGRTTKFEYDELGRRKKRTLPEFLANGPHETVDYAVSEGRLHKTLTHFNGQKVWYVHDLFDRLQAKGLAPAQGQNFEPKVSLKYNAQGQRIEMSDQANSFFGSPATYEWDALGRLTLVGRGGSFIEYTYDPQGNLTRLHHGSETADYQYDALNRLKSVAAVAGVADYTYDANGNLESVTYVNGLKHAYTYNNQNRLTELAVTKSGNPRASFTYTLNNAGHRTDLNETISGLNRILTYEYDNLYRLKKETMAGAGSVGAIDYGSLPGQPNTGYDKVGNRRSRVVSLEPDVPVLPDSTRLYEYDANDRLKPAENLPSSFDVNGNTLIGEVTPAQSADDQYDYENRLQFRHRADGRTIELIYDGDGNRVGKRIYNGQNLQKTVTYRVDQQNLTGYFQVLVEEEATIDPPTTHVRVYTYGLDLIRQRTDNIAYHYYGYDGHGSVRLLANEVGDVTDTYTYDAFGILISDWHAGAPTANNYLYAGECFDFDLGLSFNRARFLNLHSGRFWTIDPFEGHRNDPLSLHKYLYAHVDPVNRIDPSGMIDFNLSALLVTVGGIATMASQHLSAIIRQAGPMFQAGARAAWAARRLYGTFAQNTARQVVNLVQTTINNLHVEENIQRGSRFIDFVLRYGERIMDLEVKYRLPDRTGEALTRLVAQAQASINAGEAQMVIWTYKEPTVQQFQLVTTELGAAAGRVHFVHGVEGLVRYIASYFGF